MRLIDSTIRRCVPGVWVGRRWLKERLSELGVRIPLSEGCLNELVNDAEAATRRRLSAAGGGRRYLDILREEIVARAEFVHRWTCTDDRIDPDAADMGPLVRIARNYALPRPWKLSEPVAALSTRRAPSYWRWASDGMSGASSMAGRFDAGLSAGAA